MNNSARFAALSKLFNGTPSVTPGFSSLWVLRLHASDARLMSHQHTCVDTQRRGGERPQLHRNARPVSPCDVEFPGVLHEETES